MKNYATCPSCNYTRRPEDSGIVPDWQCPMCQKAYNKTGWAEPLQQSFVPARSAYDYIQVSITGERSLETVSNIQFGEAQDVDPIAMRTRWSPFVVNKVGMDNRELVEISAGRVEFRRTKGSYAFGLLFILMGSISAICSILSKRAFSSGKEMLALGIYGLFVAFGCVYLYMTNKLAVFDKAQGRFWKGRKSRDDAPVTNSEQDIISLAEIHALQLVFWQTLSTGGDRTRLQKIIELNLVLSNGGRCNVSTYQGKIGIIYGSNYSMEKKPREDALALGKFLGVPVWDAIDSTKMYWTSKSQWLEPAPRGN